MKLHAESLVAAGAWLKGNSYRFITPTPATIDRVNGRPENARARTTADALGWNRPFARDVLPAPLFDLMMKANVLQPLDDHYRSAVRFSTLGNELYAHSSHPTSNPDAVFFGPDSYRFVRLVEEVLTKRSWRPGRIIDVGCGAGVGGLSIGRRMAPAGCEELMLSDINEAAVAFARINAEINGVIHAQVSCRDMFAGLPKADLIIANPPYLKDPAGRQYRDGGQDQGNDLTLRVAGEGLGYLAPGGCLVIYTGTPIVAGVDVLKERVTKLMQDHGASFSYEELDPDVFGEELEQPAYADADRIALVGMVIESTAS